MQRVEPAASLIDRFGNEIRREGVLERVGGELLFFTENQPFTQSRASLYIRHIFEILSESFIDPQQITSHRFFEIAGGQTVLLCATPLWPVGPGTGISWKSSVHVRVLREHDTFVELCERHSCYTYLSMKNTYSVAKAQANFTQILKEAEKHPVGITRHDETVAFILSRERMDAIIETLEIMANPDAMKAIREHQAGKTKFVALSALHGD